VAAVQTDSSTRYTLSKQTHTKIKLNSKILRVSYQGNEHYGKNSNKSSLLTPTTASNLFTK